MSVGCVKSAKLKRRMVDECQMLYKCQVEVQDNNLDECWMLDKRQVDVEDNNLDMSLTAKNCNHYYLIRQIILILKVGS